MKKPVSAIEKKILAKGEEELQKCKGSPAYFYNNYVRKKGHREITDEEFVNLQETYDEYRKRKGKLPEQMSLARVSHVFDFSDQRKE